MNQLNTVTAIIGVSRAAESLTTAHAHIINAMAVVPYDDALLTELKDAAGVVAGIRDGYEALIKQIRRDADTADQAGREPGPEPTREGVPR